MRRVCLSLSLAISLFAITSAVSAQPVFVNGLTIPGATLDATRQPGANGGRLGFFSDIYYDPARHEWWALSDRGPGGGVITYGTRVQRFTLDVNPFNGRISNFRVRETIKFTDPDNLLYPHTEPTSLNGLNPRLLNGDAGILGRSFDPEGLVIDPRTGHLIVADEYGPSVYEFNRRGELVKVFLTPDNLIPRNASLGINYVDDRAVLRAGRQDNRGFEGLAITPDGKQLLAVLQDPLVNEPPPNNGRDSRNLRIVVFDNNPHSQTYGTSIAQYAYQLEPQADIAQRINILLPGNATGNDPRQGRNIGLSAIIAINAREFLVLERDNRGIGVDDPKGANAVGSKRVYKIRIDELTTDVSGRPLPSNSNLAETDIRPVTKSPLFIDLSANTQLPNGKQVEKWEGITIGPRLWNGSYLILVGNDNDYSVTQDATTFVQTDVYVDFEGNVAKCVLDQPRMCQINDVGPTNVSVPEGFSLIPGVLHAYRAPADDLAGYVKPGRFRFTFDFDNARDGGDRDEDR